MEDFNSILSELQTVLNEYKFSLYAPSTKENLEVQEVNANQQKDLLSASLDNSVYNKHFIETVKNILESFIDISKYTVFDKISFLLAIKNQMSDNIIVNSPVTEKDFNVKSSDILSKFVKKYTHPKATIVNSDHIKILVDVPSIKDEYDYDKEIHKNNKTVNDIKNTNDIKSLISDEFIGELSKCIRSIELESGKIIDLKNFKYTDRKKLVEKLPSSVIFKILTLLKDWRDEVNKSLTVKDDDGNEVVIKIDPILFVK